MCDIEFRITAFYRTNELKRLFFIAKDLSSAMDIIHALEYRYDEISLQVVAKRGSFELTLDESVDFNDCENLYYP